MKHTIYTLIIFFCAINAYSQGYSGLIARWPFNGSANDVSGNGLNGIVHGATLTAGYTGLPNTAYQFNGTGDYITVPYNSLMNAKIHSFCVLIKPTGFYSGACQGNYIIARGLEGASDFYGLEYTDNPYDGNCSTYSPANDVLCGNTGATIIADPSTAWVYSPFMISNNWYCVVLTYDGDTTKIYVNGILKTRYHQTSNYVNSTDSLNIGKGGFSPSFEYWVNGIVDEVRIYNRVLTPTEVSMFCDSTEAIINSCDSVSLPDTIKVCKNNTITLPANLIGTSVPSSILWTPSTGLSSTNILNPLLAVGTTSGWYYITITVSAPLCITKDSVYIDVAASDTIHRQDNINECMSNGPVTLNGPAGYSSYTWNTGSTASSISVNTFGTYWVNAFNGGCGLYAHTFQVTFVPSPVVSLGNDTSICNGAVITLISPEPAGAQYKWSNGSNASFIKVSDSGTYSLTVTINGCSANDSIQITTMSGPSDVNLGADTIICTGNNLSFQLNTKNVMYLWSDGSTGQNFDITKTGTYWVNESNICGSISDTINVTYEYCGIWFPSAFTPNGDGLNDIIRVRGVLDRYNDFSLSIYNRWGQRVFYTRNIYEGWDGLFNGTKQDLGTYFYMIFYSLNDKKSVMKGDFELIR